MHASRKVMAKGFTLVEILIVVVILGILAAIVVPQFTNAANEARVGNVNTQVSTIESQLELFAARNNGTYPDLATTGWGTVGGSAGTMVADNYLKEVPINPFTQSSTIVANTTFTSSLSVFTIANSTDGWAYNRTTGNIVAIQP
ncbi:MAG: prepilin-type N-terminal cleavage/methylation domain-containing protein [Phycisphaerales bacterium]|nr:prepilin-type N-terminal cleavage/methylation domain-containing protein [Phycisphaerales bacterium]